MVRAAGLFEDSKVGFIRENVEAQAIQEINAIVNDLKLLKVLFKNKMESKAPAYLGLIERNFNDKDTASIGKASCAPIWASMRHTKKS